MIILDRLTVSYPSKKRVIDELELSLPENQIHGIVGLNGAGKTTLLNTVFGLKKKDSGIITWNDKRISKQNISFLPTENYFYSNITGREYLSLFKNQYFDEDQWNGLFILPLDTIIDKYSTGMKKKLALMGVLKQDKPLMILDEPFDRIDIETGRIIRSILLRLKDKGKTILVTSHIIETLIDLCDSIHYIKEGKVQYSRDHSDFENFKKEIYEFIETRNENKIDELIKSLTDQHDVP